MLEDSLYEYIRELLQYVNGPMDQPAKNKIRAILDAEEAERNETIEDSIPEKVTEKFKSKQLSRIAIEHDYAKSCSVDDNNNMLSCNNIINASAVKVKSNDPSSKIYDLSVISNNSIYCR